jgi:sugar lactone lactonase YvrE
MKVDANGNLSDREIFGPRRMNSPGFPDGIAFDAFGNLWGTMVMSDQVFVLTPDGDFQIVLDDGNEEASIALEQAFNQDQLTPEIVLKTGGTVAPWFSSLTFGGTDLRTVYIGSLRGTRIPYFRAPVAGLPMVHWNKSPCSG